MLKIVKLFFDNDYHYIKIDPSKLFSLYPKQALYQAIAHYDFH